MQCYTTGSEYSKPITWRVLLPWLDSMTACYIEQRFYLSFSDRLGFFEFLQVLFRFVLFRVNSESVEMEITSKYIFLTLFNNLQRPVIEFCWKGPFQNKTLKFLLFYYLNITWILLLSILIWFGQDRQDFRAYV